MSKVFEDQEGNKYELVPFHPTNNPEQEGSFLVRLIAKPQKRVLITRRQWEGSDAVYISIQFPSRSNNIWINESELDLLQDALMEYRESPTNKRKG